MSYFWHLLVYLNIYIIVAISLNLVVGYCGLLTLAHAGFFAVGSYAYALASLKLGWGFIPSILVGVSLGTVLSLSVSLPSWRFKDDSFVLISLAVQVFLFSLLLNWSGPGDQIGTWANLTNGPFGISSIPKPAIFDFSFDTPGRMALLSSTVAGGFALLIWWLGSSPWGRLLKTVRDDELVARGLGKNVYWIKVQAFAISCGAVAIAGGLYASYMNYIEPGIGSIDESVLMLCMVLVGGVGNFRGPLLGALTLLLIPEVLRLLGIPIAIAGHIRLLLFGLLLVVMMHVRPQGLAGEYRME
ncbi:MAG: branched-chain amino acid ABC transporter permease [Deltaproteobacteria bacterium]|nr:branched-chain amino acid ABC transporter permease [Deltaproteobacteria bacterium]